jgi:hypothetical protein
VSATEKRQEHAATVIQSLERGCRVRKQQSSAEQNAYGGMSTFLSSMTKCLPGADAQARKPGATLCLQASQIANPVGSLCSQASQLWSPQANHVAAPSAAAEIDGSGMLEASTHTRHRAISDQLPLRAVRSRTGGDRPTVLEPELPHFFDEGP